VHSAKWKKNHTGVREKSNGVMKLDNSCSLFVRRSCLPCSVPGIDYPRIESLKQTATLYLHFSPVMFWTKEKVWNGWFHEVQLCQTNQRCESAFLWQWGGHWDTKFVHGKPSQVVVVNLAMLKKIDRKLTSMWNHETSQVDWKDGQVDETEPKKRPYKP
jgi:hypothetical protein